MYTLYKSVNTISGKIFIGIESNSKIVNLNLDYQDDVDKIGVDMFNITILKSDISTIEDAYNKRNTIVKYLQEKNHDVYNIIDNSHIDDTMKLDYHETLSKQYSFVYIVSNTINNKLYIGSHTTNNLNDGYIGTSRSFLAEVEKLGKENFKRTIVQFVETHKWAKTIESTVIIEMRESYHIYNDTAAGFGGNYGSYVNEKISIATTKRWDENYDLMMATCQNKDALEKRGKSVSDWIKNNKEAHMERMMKINTNPEKIRRTAEKHTGMKRSDTTKSRLSDARNKTLSKAETEDEYAQLTGKGLVFVTNTTNYTYKRVEPDYELQENEVFGQLRDPKDPLKKEQVITNILNWTEYKKPAGYVLESFERRGNKKRVKKAYNEGTLV